jgi:autoinducer 2-degrading protein
MITIAVTYVIREGCETRAEAFMRELTAATRAEPGCRTYGIHRSLEHPRTYLFFEEYDDAAAFEAHRASPHFARLGKNGLQTIMESRIAATYEPLE